MKKAISILVSLSVFVTLLSIGCFSSSAANETTFVFGDKTVNTMDEQGQQGFYAGYVPETNKGADMNANNYTLTGDKAFALCNKKGSEADCTKWTADPNNVAGTWLGERADGFVGPDASSAAIKWVAPSDGTYSLKVKYEGGSSGDGKDGIVFNIYKQSGTTVTPIKREDSNGVKAGVSGYDYSNDTDTMTAGDCYYFIVDPKTGSNSDGSFWRIIFMKVSSSTDTTKPQALPSGIADYSNSANGTVFGYGVDNGSTCVNQGEQSFFYMWGAAVNKGNAYPVYALNYCDNANADDPTEEPIWVPQGFPSIGYWFCIKKDGFVMPDSDSTAAVMFVAPVSGTYSLDSSYAVGTQEGQTGKDGVVFGIYQNNTCLKSQDSNGEHLSAVSFTKEVTLTQGDRLYFVSDPKASSANDDPHWSIKVNLLSGANVTESTTASTAATEATETTKATENSGTVSTSSDNGTSTTEAASTSVKTGDAGFAGLICLAGISAAAVFVLKKTKFKKA